MTTRSRRGCCPRCPRGCLARAFVEFRTRWCGYDVADFLARVCERCVEVLEVSAVGPSGPTARDGLGLVSASTQAVAVLEALQVRRQEGPCLDAYRSGERVVVGPFVRLRRYARLRGLGLTELARQVVDGPLTLEE